jgi:hypothetical protein
LASASEGISAVRGAVADMDLGLYNRWYNRNERM